MYQLMVYIPEAGLEQVKQAMFAAGAGRIGDYDSCCWQVLGEGQYRPLPGSQPYRGATHKLERVAEYRVELVCADQCLAAVLEAMLAAHPYETPAYSYWRVNQP